MSDDITESKKAEERLRESQAQLNELSANIADGMVYEMDAGTDGLRRRLTYLSPAVERLHGLTVEAVLRDPGLVYGQVVEEDRERFADAEARVFAFKKKLEIDVRVRLPSGEIRWRRFIASPRRGENGTWLWDGIEVDITERKKAEEELRESQAQLRELSANLADGMVYQIDSGPDGRRRRFTYLSPAVVRLHGLTAKAAQRKPSLIYNQVVEEDRERLADAEARAFASKRKMEIDARVRLPSGEIRWRRFISSPRRGENGTWLWDGIEVDITERKKAEERLREQNAELERKNIALSEVIAQVETEKLRLKEELAAGLDQRIGPLLHKLSARKDLRKYAVLLRKQFKELTDPFRPAPEVRKFRRLSRKEREICELVRGGLATKEIADLLGVSRQTIDVHRRNIRKKLGLTNQGQGLAAFLQP
ncbi:MAG: PAS domain-containing protein [Elusimicrobiota bacterium]